MIDGKDMKEMNVFSPGRQQDDSRAPSRAERRIRVEEDGDGATERPSDSEREIAGPAI